MNVFIYWYSLIFASLPPIPGYYAIFPDDTKEIVLLEAACMYNKWPGKMFITFNKISFYSNMIAFKVLQSLSCCVCDVVIWLLITFLNTRLTETTSDKFQGYQKYPQGAVTIIWNRWTFTISSTSPTRHIFSLNTFVCCMSPQEKWYPWRFLPVHPLFRPSNRLCLPWV